MFGYCGPAVFPTCVFVRVVAAVTFECLEILGTSIVEHMRFECDFFPRDTFPTKAYDLTCEGAYLTA